jgi:hypothetical protein
MTKTTLIYSSDYDLFTERHMLLPISHPNYNEIIVVVELSGEKDNDNMPVWELGYDDEGIDIISAYEVDDMRLDIISREYNLSVEEVGT